MKSISKNILLITLLVVINLGIFVFCKLMTDEGNFLWGKTSSERSFLVSMASMDLMRIYYFIYANSINIFLLGIYYAFYTKKRFGFLVMILGVVIFVGGKKIFEEQVVKSYYTIFKNQQVPEDFMLEPIKSAGKDIGHFLMADIRNVKEPMRKYAIMGVGKVRYEDAADVLNTILYSEEESPAIRAQAYKSLVQINSEKSNSYARIFKASVHPEADYEVLMLLDEQ